MKRGQSALEYLVTYGWAILAIVIIGGVLWYFGIFSPSSFAGASSCAGFAAFTCQDYSAVAAATFPNNFTIVLSNRVGSTIKVNSVTISGTGVVTPTNTTQCFKGTADYKLNTDLLSADEILTCTMNAVPTGSVKGAEFGPATFSLTYTDQRSNLQHTDTGTIRGKYS